MMKRRLHRSGSPFPFMPAVLGLGVLLVLVPFAVASCGMSAGAKATTLNAGITITEIIPATSTTVVVDPPYTTSSTTPASVPALSSGITAGQIEELVASWSTIPAQDWNVREYKTLGDWAVSNVYTDKLPAQIGQDGVGAVFQEKSGAWFFEGWVSVADSSKQQEIELANMGAPKEVWTYFGLEPTSRTTGQSALPEQMPADFGFVAEWWRNSLDTFKGTFTKDLVAGSPITATANLSLTRDEMERVYQELVAMDILSYPAAFAPPYAEVTTPGTEHTVSGVINYHLRLTAAGIEKDISWSDVNGSTTQEAVALRDWFRRLMELIISKPEYKAMPQARGGYA